MCQNGPEMISARYEETDLLVRRKREARGSALTPVTPVGPGTGECISIH